MWRERIIEAKKAQGLSPKAIAERTLHHPERTIIRLLNGETENPYVDTVLEVGAAVGLSPQEIFSESNLILGHKDLLSLQTELDVVRAERDLLTTENSILSDRVASLIAEIDLLKTKLEHKEEILKPRKYEIM